MRGTYRIFSDGILVAESENLITTVGRQLILRHLAGSMSSFAGAIVLGSSEKAPLVSDIRLGFEFMRGPITVGAADVNVSRLRYKATMPLNSEGSIFEMGIYPATRVGANGLQGRLYSAFDPRNEEFTGGTINTTNFRVGASSYSVTAAAAGSKTANTSQMSFNAEAYAATDVFSLAYFLADANTSSITVRLYADSGNYFSYNFPTASAAGYYVADWPRSAFAATGTPTWTNIVGTDVIVNATAAGATTVHLDGFRVSDAGVYPDYGLVSRTLLTAPVSKRAGEQMEVEYVLDLNF